VLSFTQARSHGRRAPLDKGRRNATARAYRGWCEGQFDCSKAEAYTRRDPLAHKLTQENTAGANVRCETSFAPLRTSWLHPCKFSDVPDGRAVAQTEGPETIAKSWSCADDPPLDLIQLASSSKSLEGVATRLNRKPGAVARSARWFGVSLKPNAAIKPKPKG
jgi:hypothetical protein